MMIKRVLRNRSQRSCSVFFTVTCSGHGAATRRWEGRAPRRKTAGRKRLTEAAPPGKRPNGNVSARSSLIYFNLKAAFLLFINRNGNLLVEAGGRKFFQDVYLRGNHLHGSQIESFFNITTATTNEAGGKNQPVSLR